MTKTYLNKSPSNVLAVRALKARNKYWCQYFPYYVKRYLAKHFQNIQTFRPLNLGSYQQRSVVIYTNHPSWWDPMIYMWLAHQFLPQHQHFGPMDKAGLDQYAFMRKLGIFPVEPDSSRGGIQFLRTATGLLEHGSQVDQAPVALWIAATGEFQDAQYRPLALQAGLSHLARRLARQFP